MSTLGHFVHTWGCPHLGTGTVELSEHSKLSSNHPKSLKISRKLIENKATKSQMVKEEKRLTTDREDESKLEIPAFLRRQAN